MLRLRRKLLRDTLLLGAALTLAVVAVDQGHGLASLENWAYDRRARAFQFFTPPPTDKLVHLDIDDRALDVIGRWPWSRSTIAELMNEIHLAGPKVVAMDIVFSEPEKVRYEPVDPEHSDSEKVPIDADALLTAAFKNCGNVILPVILGNFDPPGKIDQEIESIYRKDLESSDTLVTDHLAAAGFSKSDIAKAVGQGDFLKGRRAAAHSLVRQAISQKDESLESIEHRLLKSVSAHDVDQWHSPTTRLLEEAYTDCLAVRTACSFAIPLQTGEELLEVDDLQSAPLARFGQVTKGTAFVDYQFAGEPVVRNSPLLIAADQRAFLQLGLAMACRMLDIDVNSIRVEKDRIVLPLLKGQSQIDIPVRTVTSVHRVPTVMYIPWIGTDQWQTMYDWPNHRESRQHMSVNQVWDICLTQHYIETNNASIDGAIFQLLDGSAIGLDPPAAKKYFAAIPPSDQMGPRRELGNAALRQLELSGKERAFMEASRIRQLTPDETFQREVIRAAKSALADLLPQNDKLERQRDLLRTQLQKALAGRAVLVGMTFSSSTTDVVTTSLHDRTPGVIVHGAIFNAIMTRHFWRAAPAYATVLLTLLAGFATAAITIRLSPVPAMLVSVLLLMGYVILNGLLFFDHYGLVVGLAGPCLAITVVWAGCVMLQTIIEARERALITRRFQTYVDPSLVNYYMENPHKVDMKAERKELTVVFTDLANFTKMTEKLGERSVELLNRYLTLMVPAIRSNTPPGYLNKFLGDGIMFFYGAPYENPDHAAHAVEAAFKMQQIMLQFNAELVAEGLPELGVRAGISTGQMLVGDAGSKNAADYTVLGDAVNLGARLESANKYLGTRILMTARTAELAKDKFLFCPVGKLRVVGKTEGIFVFEGVVPGEDPADVKARIQLTTAMIRAYQAGEFAVCIVAAEGLVQSFPTSGKLAALYHEVCQQYLRDGAPADFDGSISLAEK